MTPQTIKWEDFVIWATNQAGSQSFVYRGQSNSDWGLTNSLLRQFPNLAYSDLLALERRLTRHFAHRSQLHFPQAFLPMSFPISNLDQDVNWVWWWMLMQHYGVPTRLLDWTMSPFVAAYFTVESDADSDGAIWYYDTASLEEMYPNRTLYDGASNWLSLLFHEETFFEDTFTIESHHMNDRIAAQQGVFTLPRSIRTDIASVLDFDQATAGKIVISKHDKPTFMRMLRSMNVTAGSLFPGPEGFGRSVAEFARGEAERIDRVRSQQED